MNRDIVAGFNTLEDYLKNDVYLGCIVGRYANRIANGKFKINGTDYQLACNNGLNHLHGGNKGFDKVIWEAEIVDDSFPKLSLTYFSKDGEEGYPGNLKVSVEYFYTDDDELQIEYFAETDKTTPVTLTNHSYFNLTGDLSKNILDHQLLINAGYYTVVNENQVPTGELKTVENTRFDFRKQVSLSANSNRWMVEYDHNFVLNKPETFSFAALLYEPTNELQLFVYTTEPGLQLYCGNLLDGTFKNRDDKPLNKYAALCLETQHFPDSLNHPDFPSVILSPDKKYFSKTAYKITVT